MKSLVNFLRFYILDFQDISSSKSRPVFSLYQLSYLIKTLEKCLGTPSEHGIGFISKGS